MPMPRGRIPVRIDMLRIDWGPGYRIYFGKDGDDVVILLGGGTKSRQQADIERAKMLWAEYKTRKSAESKTKGKQ
jgi:putative addiction module killer protein